jgi:hypothetical protein
LAAPEKEVQYFRTIDLGELLFNLQHIEGFDGCVARLKGGDVEPALAELDVARMLYINDQMFWFVEPQGKTGDDYDFLVLYPGGVGACIEAKCNIETPEVNLSTIKNSLQKARKQLPETAPGIIFVKLPAQWLSVPEFQRKSIETAMAFLRGTKKIVSVKYYVAPFHFVNGHLGQGHMFKEITNPQHRFDTSRNWDLLSHWIPPADEWNTLPRKYVRLVFFPLMGLGLCEDPNLQRDF